MSTRPVPVSIAIEQAIAAAIQAHAVAHPDLWAVVPSLVDYGPKASHQDAPRPLTVVHVDGIRETHLLGGAEHRAEVSIMVFLMVQDPGDPSRAIHDYVADNKRAIAQDEGLLIEGGPLANGYLRLESTELYVDADEGSAGDGLALMKYVASCCWTHDSP